MPKRRPVSDEDDYRLLVQDIVEVVSRDLAKAKSPVRILFGREAIAAQQYVARWVPTGIYHLDWTLSQGKGLPTGRSIEVFGAEATGKTALCEFTAGLFRRLGSPIHYLDYEQSLDEGHLGCYGVSIDDLIIADCPTMEDGWDYIDRVLCRMSARAAERTEKNLPRDPPTLFIYDSIAQATPRAELDEDAHEDAHVGVMARAAAKGFRKHARRIANSSALLLFVNQLRSVVGASKFQAQTTTPGGRAPKYAYSIRLQLHKADSITKGDKPIGQVIGVTTKKNKHAPYPQVCQVVLSYRNGVDVPLSNFLFFRERRCILPAGKAGYKWRGKKETFRKPEFSSWQAANTESVSAAVQECYDEMKVESSSAEATPND